VARIVTPGTLIDEKFMDPYENNFLLSIHIDGKQQAAPQNGLEELPSGQFRDFSDSQVVGLSWLDLSTGDFFTQYTSPQLLPSAIARIGAREVLLDQEVDEAVKNEMQALVGGDQRLLTYFPCTKQSKKLSEWRDVFESTVSAETASSFTQEELVACNMLLEYVQAQMQGMDMKLQPPRRRHLDDSMIIDRNSLKGLEILETARDGLGKGSLLHAVRRTSTKSGARLLKDRLGETCNASLPRDQTY
jgi:DNA mismatch repair ATPase MutS